MSLQNSDLTIKIQSGSANAAVSLANSDGTSNHKTVAIDDLISTLTSSHKISTGILPRNTRFFNGTQSKYRIGLETVPRVRNFAIWSRSIEDSGQRKILEIPFPPCLFVFDVSGKKLVSAKVFALRNLVSSDMDELYWFPFGNIYDDYRVCWGTAKLPTIKMPMNLISVISVFLDSHFNGDLHRSSGLQGENGETLDNFWSFIQYLNKKEVFPDKFLRIANEKLSDLMRE